MAKKESAPKKRAKGKSTTTAATPKKQRAKGKSVTALAAAAKSGQTQALRELKPVATEINKRMEQAATLDGKAADHRLSASLRLAEAKDKCKANKISFQRWCDDHVVVLYETARQLARIGASGDEDTARLALEDLRAKNARNNVSMRKRTATAAGDGQPQSRAATAGRVQSNDPTGYLGLLDGAQALGDTQRIEFANEVLSGQGLSVVPHDVARAAALAGDDLREHVVNQFEQVPAAQQRALAERLVSRLGGTVKWPKREPTSVAEVTGGEGDAFAIPKKFKRTPRDDKGRIVSAKKGVKRRKAA